MTPERALGKIQNSLALPRAMGYSEETGVMVNVQALDTLVEDYEDLKFRMEGLEK